MLETRVPHEWNDLRRHSRRLEHGANLITTRGLDMVGGDSGYPSPATSTSASGHSTDRRTYLITVCKALQHFRAWWRCCTTCTVQYSPLRHGGWGVCTERSENPPCLDGLFPTLEFRRRGAQAMSAIIEPYAGLIVCDFDLKCPQKSIARNGPPPYLPNPTGTHPERTPRVLYFIHCMT